VVIFIKTPSSCPRKRKLPQLEAQRLVQSLKDFINFSYYLSYLAL